MVKERTRTQYKEKLVITYDRWLLVASFILLCLGLLMVASASMVISGKQFHSPFHFLFHQLLYLAVGLAFGWLILRVSTETWYKMGPILLLVSLLLLILVLIPGIGHIVNGSRRWMKLGPFSLQVSELAKIAVIVYLSGYLVRRASEVRAQVSGFIKPMVLITTLVGALLLEPDFGASMVIMITALGMMFLAGVRLWQFAVLFLLVAGMLILLAVSAPYRMERLTSFTHPWANQFGSGYQLTQSLMAFGRGGVFGVGLGNSIQKLFYLPEAHTDFLFAVLAEELGLIGQVIVIVLFAVLVGRALLIGRQAQKLDKFFASYLAYGMALYFGLQVMINVGVNLGVLPTKGLTLPLMSYGGSSMLINCLVLAILFRVSAEVGMAPNRQVTENVRVRRRTV